MDSAQLSGGYGGVKSAVLKIIFLAWVIVWAFFVARELLVKDNLRDYIALAGRSLEGKRAYVTGEDLYGFLNFCRANVPSGAKVSIAGLEDGSLERRRAVYYLYPLTESPEPEYILAYGKAAAGREGYPESAAGEHGRIYKKIEAAQ
jgi:hypothetical protein